MRFTLLLFLLPTLLWAQVTPDVIIAEVGAGTENPMTYDFGREGVICPGTVDRTNWLGGYTYPDTFGVVHDGTTIIVTRTDSGLATVSDANWSMNLRFECTVPATVSAVVACTTDDEGSITSACKCDDNSVTNECEVGQYCWSDNTCNDHDKPVDCTVNTLTATTVPCFCGASTDACATGQFCRDDSCHADASHDDCLVSAYDPVTHDCGCTQSICDAGRFCYAATCNDNAHCERPANIDSGVFYGAKVYGEWDQLTKTMLMKVPIPGYFTLDNISWYDAADTSVLKYTDANHGLWAVNEDNACMVVYELNAYQNVFFGPGSMFHINGHLMKAAIDVDVHTDITRVHMGHSYHRQRHVSNVLPVMVRLIPETDVQVEFRTTYALPGQEEEGPIKSVVIVVDCEDMDFVTVKQECQVTYGDPAGLTCDSVECSPENFTQVNFEEDLDDGEEPGSEQDEINELIDTIVKDAWLTATLGPYPCKEGEPIKLEPAEFVIFLEAHENVLVEESPTITILMETHSRGCVDHTTLNMGVQVAADSKAWVDTSVPEIFDWEMDATTISLENPLGIVKNYVEWNLCVEIVEWTFTPFVKSDGTYSINLVFDQQLDLPSFIAMAEITIAKSDVLGSVGFDKTITLWEDVSSLGVPENESYEFQIGERFWAMIELSNLVVDTDTIACTKFTVTQYPEEADLTDKSIDPIEDGVHDMLNIDVYNFQKHATTLKDTAIFGAELELETFYLSLTGVTSVLDVGISITYQQGSQEYLSLRRILHGNGDLDWETAVGEDDAAFAAMERAPEEKFLKSEFGIMGREENMVGMMFRKVTTHPRYTGLVLFGMVAAALAMNAFGSKSSVQAYLLDEEF